MKGIDGMTAIVGVGSTDYCHRGASLPRTPLELACEAVLAACADAGVDVKDVDGFAYYSGGFDTPLFAQTLGLREVNFSAMLTGGGSGSAGSAGLAAAAIIAGQAEIVVSVLAVQQPPGARLGAAAVVKSGPYYRPPTPQKDFTIPYGVIAPGHGFSMVFQRHMHLYGTQRAHLAEVCINQRTNALNRPKALQKAPLTIDDYMSARMISDPLCLFDYTMETDGAVAVVTTSAERARDLRHPPAYIMATAAGGDGNWSGPTGTTLMPDDLYPSAGAAHSARRLYAQAGIAAADVDVALLYDHFSPMVLMQLEDYGFCGRGESGPFVAEGNIRLGGKIPVNTHGGHLSEAYIIGMTHLVEAVEQVRGTAINQVAGCEIALASGGPSIIPTSSILLRK